MVEILDCAALFHGNILSPMLEVAMMQLEERCKNTGMKMVGTYFANEHLENHHLPPISTQITEKIKAEFPLAFVLLLDNTKLSLDPTECAVEIYTQDNKKGKEWTKGADKELQLSGDTFGSLKGLLEDSKYWTFYDFDNHLDDLSKDWFNTSVLS